MRDRLYDMTVSALLKEAGLRTDLMSDEAFERNYIEGYVRCDICGQTRPVTRGGARARYCTGTEEQPHKQRRMSPCEKPVE